MSFTKKKALRYIEQVNRKNIREFEKKYPELTASIEEAAKYCIEKYWYVMTGVCQKIHTDENANPEEVDTYIRALGFKVTNETTKEPSDKEDYKNFYIIRFNIF